MPMMWAVSAWLQSALADQLVELERKRRLRRQSFHVVKAEVQQYVVSALRASWRCMAIVLCAYWPTAKRTGLPMRLNISTSVSMVNLVVFFVHHVRHARAGHHQDFRRFGLLQVVLLDPRRQLGHELFLELLGVIDLLLRRQVQPAWLPPVRNPSSRNRFAPVWSHGGFQVSIFMACFSSR